MRRCLTGCAAVAVGAMLALTAEAQELVIWHDKGDDGIRMIEQMAEVFQKDHPDVAVTSVSFPTEQWFSKTIAALNTGSSPDIIFNDNPRIVRIMQTTGKLSDLGPELAGLAAADAGFITDGDRAAATYEGRVIMIPFQRTITGLGVRQSWLEKVGERPPVTWDDVLRVGRKFQENDPDGNGRNDTYGLAMQAGNAESMISAGIGLLVYGSGAPHYLVDDEGQVVVDQPEVSQPTIEYLKLFTDYELVSPDTVNHTFTDMYQLIEGGRVGMFRVGNWNVAKWDRETIKGDFLVQPYPVFEGEGPGNMVVGSVRGMAVPSNAPNPEIAKEFVSFIVTEPAQQFSLNNMGGVVRSDLDTSGVTPSLKPFVDPETRLQTDDFLSAKFPWFLELREFYYRKLIGAVSSPPADWDAFIAETADELRAEAQRLKQKS